MSVGWTRRSFLASGALQAVAGVSVTRAAEEPRVAALDWAMAATLLNLGAPPIGIAEQRLYRGWVATPAIPDGIAELGLRTAPSFETLAVLNPDILAINALDAGIRDRLETIAPTIPNTTFTAARAPLDGCRAMTRVLAGRIGRSAEAEMLIRATEARFIAARARLAAGAHPPMLPLTIIDRRHISLYGHGSLYADVMMAVGLVPAFTGPTSVWGSTTLGVEALAAVQPCDLLVIAPVPVASQPMLEGGGLWASLVATGGHRVVTLPPVWAFGDLSAAARFADILADVLTTPATGAERPT